jgi:hypothetical protein
MKEVRAKTKPWIIAVGVILVFLSSLTIGIFNIGVVYLFGIPILTLVMGNAFVWASGSKIKTKIIVTLTPVAIIPIAFFSAYQLNKAEPETYLIPKDHRGNIVVFFDETCGSEPIFESGRRIYQIPNTGVLITKFKMNNGYLDQKIYFVDDSGARIQIPFFQRQNFETEKEEWGRFRSSPVSGFTKETVGVFWAYGAETYGLSKNSNAFIVSNFQYLERDEKARWTDARQFTKNAGKLLNECRETQ